MHCHWRIHIELQRPPGEYTDQEFYLDATDFDLESLLEEPEIVKSAVLRLMHVPLEAGMNPDEGLRNAARDQGDALLQRLFWDDCINASVTFSDRAGFPEFEQATEPPGQTKRQPLMVKHGVEFGRVVRSAS